MLDYEKQHECLQRAPVKTQCVKLPVGCNVGLQFDRDVVY